VEPERVLASALERVGEALAELEEVPAGLELAALEASEAHELVLRALRGQRVPPMPLDAGPAAVEIVGWLDLPLVDAPALILTGFNDGQIPQSVGAHAFLPDALRASLRLPGDARASGARRPTRPR
jgi:inactivated superfamily I helicase